MQPRTRARSRENLKHSISTTTTPMAAKPGKVVKYHEELPFLKLYDYYSIAWFCEVT